MGRIVATVDITNASQPENSLKCDAQRFPLARNLMFLKVVILQQTHKDLLIFFVNHGVTGF